MGIAKEQARGSNKASILANSGVCNTTFVTRAWKSVGIFNCGRTALKKKGFGMAPSRCYSKESLGMLS